MTNKNINKRTNKTIFVDLDGTLVIHNYDPENFEDLIIENTFNILIEKNKDSEIILTTARTRTHCVKIISKLKKRGLVFSKILYNLSSGPRILINDKGRNGEVKAFSINLNRNEGIRNFDDL